MQVNPGEVEVIVLQDTTFNGPDHKSLGPLKSGQSVLTAAGVYAEWLVEHGFACYPEDFQSADEENPLAELDQLILEANQVVEVEPEAEAEPEPVVEAEVEAVEPAAKTVKKPGRPKAGT